MVLDIVQYGSSVLRENCSEVKAFDSKVEELAANMVETMVDAEGIGIAAPQVGVALRLAVVDVAQCPEGVTYFRVDGKEEDFMEWMPLVFYNPAIVGTGEVVLEREGCLSIRGIQESVARPFGIKADLYIPGGRKVCVECDGLLARAIQHEVDHLNGVLFIDRLPASKKVLLKGKLKRLACKT